ncbi:MAG: DUF4325 domain-containing protein [Dehalococcoidia bacterium]
MVVNALADAWDGERLTVDFRGVEAVTPSFVDEVLTSIEKVIETKHHPDASVVFLNPPTRLSEKFAAVGRAHKLTVAETEDGAWVLSTQHD